MHDFNIIKRLLHPDYIGTLDETIDLKEKSDIYTGPNSLEGYSNSDEFAISYITNNYGFRSQSFDNISSESINILFSGCSWTWGSGLPDSYVWRSILTEKFKNVFPDKDVQQYNTATCAGSISLACKNTLALLRKTDNIDYIYMLFPGFHRSTGFKKENEVYSMVKLYTVLPESPSFKNKQLKEYSKNYKEIESIYHNLVLIQSVIDICKLKGVKFFFGTWDTYCQHVYEYMNLDGYCTIPDWEQVTDKDADLKLVSANGVYPGLDHMTKIADAFYEATFNGK